MKIKLDGVTTSDKNIVKREILKRVIYKKAERMLVGANAIPLENSDALDLKFTLPKQTEFKAEKVAEGARGTRKRLEWYEVQKYLEKYQTEVLITDEAKARSLEKLQTRKSIDAASRGLALAKDEEIFLTLSAGAGHSEAATGGWNSDPTNAVTDISKAISYIMDNTKVLETELKNMNVFYPAKLFGYLTQLTEIENMHRSVMDYMKAQWGIGFYPTRQLDDVALVIVKSEETGFHYTYTGKDVPTSEEERIPGVGDNYIVTQYFKTFIMPETEGGTTNKLIYKVTNVVA